MNASTELNGTSPSATNPDTISSLLDTTTPSAITSTLIQLIQSTVTQADSSTRELGTHSSVMAMGSSTTDMMRSSMGDGDLHNSSMSTSSMMSSSSTENYEADVGITWDDATWVLICTFIIFTMQSGFGLLESGCVSSKNEVNIMYKNTADVIFGGIVYWLFGYGLSFGESKGANAFCGVGYWAVSVTDPRVMGGVFVSFVFQLSFATTAATIVSGAMAERVKLHSYIIYASFNTFAYCIPAHWVWDSRGFLNKLGVVDIAGSGAYGSSILRYDSKPDLKYNSWWMIAVAYSYNGVVHLCGGTAALVSSMMLGPRKGRYDKNQGPPPANSTNIILGTMMLWWGWMGFNMGSTYGVQDGLWKLAARAAANTLIASMGGGLTGVLFSVITKKKKYSVGDLCNGVLGGLVGVTAPCAVVWPFEAFFIGLIGGFVAVTGVIMFDKLKVDDPVGAISVHGLAGIWGMLSVGFFMSSDSISGLSNGKAGVFHGGDGSSIGVQLLAVLCIIAWSGTIALVINAALKFSPLGLRMSEKEEEAGADAYEHEIGDEPEIHVDVLPSSDGDKPGLAYLYGRRRSAFGYRREEANEEEAEQKAAEVFESDLKKFQDKYAHLNKALEACDEEEEEEEETSLEKGDSTSQEEKENNCTKI